MCRPRWKNRAVAFLPDKSSDWVKCRVCVIFSWLQRLAELWKWPYPTSHPIRRSIVYSFFFTWLRSKKIAHTRLVIRSGNWLCQCPFLRVFFVFEPLWVRIWLMCQRKSCRSLSYLSNTCLISPIGVPRPLLGAFYQSVASFLASKLCSRFLVMLGSMPPRNASNPLQKHLLRYLRHETKER